ncbi:hypothetical protein CEXT_254661 [Caerostris extrusa]|uniref:Uncharacterized protein n=1 Tax=Caerostris extrusa TaxID=172846 RepID=A0AAV4Q160_CAEEX|nr:hypothetical protein CEXT_254661 [Caerostris extrusa]
MITLVLTLRFLRVFDMTSKTVKEQIEIKNSIRENPILTIMFYNDQEVWVVLHPFCNTPKKKTSKCMPKRDGPYIILIKNSPSAV